MKKAVFSIGIIALAGTVFSVVGWYFVRGIKIYSLNTTFGLVLSGSWKLCMVATLAVWAVFVVAFIKFVLSKKADAAVVKLAADGKKRNKDGKIEPTAATAIMSVNLETGATLNAQTQNSAISDKTKNKKATNTPVEKENKKNKSTDADSVITEAIMPNDDATELLSQAEVVKEYTSQAKAATIATNNKMVPLIEKPLPSTEDNDATVLLCEEKVIPDLLTTQKTCPTCKAIMDNKKFCTSCGTKLD